MNVGTIPKRSADLSWMALLLPARYLLPKGDVLPRHIIIPLGSMAKAPEETDYPFLPSMVDVLPKLVCQPQPVIPDSVLQTGIERDVPVSLDANAQGRVREVHFVPERTPSRTQVLHAAARKVATQMVFTPAMQNGYPVLYRVWRKISFRLN